MSTQNLLKQRILDDRQQLINSIQELQSRIAQQSGAVQYADALLAHIEAMEAQATSPNGQVQPAEVPHGHDL